MEFYEGVILSFHCVADFNLIDQPFTGKLMHFAFGKHRCNVYVIKTPAHFIFRLCSNKQLYSQYLWAWEENIIEFAILWFCWINKYQNFKILSIFNNKCNKRKPFLQAKREKKMFLKREKARAGLMFVVICSYYLSIRKIFIVTNLLQTLMQKKIKSSILRSIFTRY